MPGLSLPAVKDFVGEGGGLGGFLAEPALTALDRQDFLAPATGRGCHTDKRTKGCLAREHHKPAKSSQLRQWIAAARQDRAGESRTLAAKPPAKCGSSKASGNPTATCPGPTRRKHYPLDPCQVSQPVHPREQNFAEATGLLHVRVPMPTMLSPGANGCARVGRSPAWKHPPQTN